MLAVIYSHSHADHFGGVKGVVSEEDVRSSKVSILAPDGFLEHAVSENIYAGNAMGRRSTYMYGPVLPRSVHGQVDAGLGKTISNGIPDLPPTVNSPDLLKAMTVPMYFDYLGVRLNGPNARGKRIRLNWNFTDVKEQYTLQLENSALTYTPGKQAPDADATLTLTRETLDAINIGKMTVEQAIKQGAIQIKGNKAAVKELFGLFETFQQSFPIVTP